MNSYKRLNRFHYVRYRLLLRVSPAITLLLLYLLTAVVPVSADNYAPMFPFFSTASVSCSTGFVLNGAAVNPYPQHLVFRTLVDSGGLRYTDQLTDAGLYPVPNFGGILTVGTTNEGGTANTAWPIPSGSAVTITLQILRDGVLPVTESRVILNSCDGAITSSESGVVDSVIRNIGFENAGASDAQPDQWEMLVDNDKRVCNSEVPGVAHSGECAYQMKPGPANKNKLSQDAFLDPIALQGDQLRLGAWIKAGSLPTGSSLIYKIKFPTESKIKRKIEIPAGTYDYQYISLDAVNLLGEAPSKVSVIIQSKGAGGSLVIDDVQAQVAVGAGFAILERSSTGGSRLVPLPGGVPSSSTSAPINGIDLAHPPQ